MTRLATIAATMVLTASSAMAQMSGSPGAGAGTGGVGTGTLGGPSSAAPGLSTQNAPLTNHQVPTSPAPSDRSTVGSAPGINPMNPSDLTTRSNPQDVTTTTGRNPQDRTMPPLVSPPSIVIPERPR